MSKTMKMEHMMRYISTGTCSGDQYSKISSDEIGEKYYGFN